MQRLDDGRWCIFGASFNRSKTRRDRTAEWQYCGAPPRVWQDDSSAALGPEAPQHLAPCEKCGLGRRDWLPPEIRSRGIPVSKKKDPCGGFPQRSWRVSGQLEKGQAAPGMRVTVCATSQLQACRREARRMGRLGLPLA